MPKLLIDYVRLIDRVNRAIGRLMMYGLFVMMAILLWSVLSKQLFVVPAFWTLEMAQYALVSYYLVGGPYALQLGANVRMDLFYSRWSEPTQARVDSLSTPLMIVFLLILLYGGIESLGYAIDYRERSASLWRPLMWPVKAVMCFGLLMMLLQAIAEQIRVIAKARGVRI